MRFREEVVRIHAGGEHRGERSGGFVGLDGGGKHHKIRVDVELPVCEQVGRLHVEHVSVGRDLADHALDVVYAVFLDGAAVELVKALAGRTNVDVEHVHVGVGILVPDEHRVLGGVHAADLGAVFLASAVVFASGADALHEHDGVRVLLIGRTEQCTACRTGGIHEPLQLQGGDNVLRLGVRVFVVLFQRDRVVAGRRDDGAVILGDVFVLLRIVDGARGADLGTHAALAGFQHRAVVRIDRRDLRNGLRERDIDGAPLVHAQIELIWHLLLRTFLGTQPAAGADVLFDVACLALDFDVEIADEAADLRHLAVREDADFFVLSGVDHFRGQDARRAVQGREGLVELRHFAADGGLGFDDIDRETRVRDVERGLDSRDAAADDQCALGDRGLARCERCVQLDLGDGGFAQNDRLFGAGFFVLMDP